MPRYVMESAPAAETVISGQRYLYFGGTGYYTLQNHPAVLQAAAAALARYGMHPATSRGGFGTTPLYVALEAAAARFFGSEDAAYIASGYLSNLAALQALVGAADFSAVFVDQGSHYSLTDLLPVLGLPVVPFAHRDPEDLRRGLLTHLRTGQRALIVSDGIFPLMGHLAPLPAYLEVASAYDAVVWLDDSHGVGVLGERGRGTCEHYGLASERVLFGGTLSKAFGAYGGIIPGRGPFVRAVRAGHVMTGATSPTSSAAAAALAGMELLEQHPEWRMQLWENARMLKAGLRRLGLPVEDTPVPIAAWALGSARQMDAVQQALMARGICIQRAHYVGAGTAGVLRVVVFSTHTAEQIGRLLEELQRVL
ncbi:MAG: pyridoxal phosphate-dependent aminotransferase family protein [Armatimonadota bacterium]|nr:pyridoxal phosphate-dependent aminotransferase family protein [Armatimonadota bacterium]MDR7426139.1 pyridoxal phosphate-dependent aminotransferase family protein [Armatimonadota bacterium]MDR7463504.1 pyridoxal phosphate-dependent aminotransferase family protein [Armatimonadota bacterium]MDR7471047.1 pyridoxal phosphate-dependent aminotransferase family protein [Armatimonadota bacterium]MDR7475334.1 pyridoxal phosphate-dependent aminotransferase family protein [Armatimonadota bacterium]